MYFASMPPSHLIFDEDQTFLSSVMQYMYKRLGIKIKTISPYNHCSLKTERHIRTISEIITNSLPGHIICKFVLMHTSVLQAQH